MLTREMMKEVGSKAFFSLKKVRFYEIKKDNHLTTLTLFGKYKYYFDSSRKIVWGGDSTRTVFNFRLCSRHKDWEYVFKFPTSYVYRFMQDNSDFTLRTEKDQKKFSAECNIIASQVYKSNNNKLRSIFGGIIWKHYDPEVISLCLKIFGLSVSSFEYSLIWNNKKEVIDTLEKGHGGILPIWAKLSGRKEDDFNYVSQTFASPDIIKQVKENLVNLTNSGWRFLIKLSPRSVNLIYTYTYDSFTKFINWLAHVGVVPRYTLLKYLLRNCVSVPKTEDLTALMRIALKQSYKVVPIVGFFSQQIMPVLDWFYSGPFREFNPDLRFNNKYPNRVNHLQFDSNQRKASWSWFMRQQVEWHQDILKKQKEGVKNENWISLVDEITIGKYKVIPLTNTYALIDEGKEMHHCVGSYSQSCLINISRVFSIRTLNDGKVATVEIRKSNDYYQVNQCSGPCNMSVPSDVTKIAEKVKNLYNKKISEKVLENDK